ncbi:hypothetical protein [Carboxylicivirga marina]|uniref:hypothetical protein n=1 Tax=Carboxylicivirga marina TaxID=2800988 RepID=UPI002591A227|nr:hypothetical protein [uncultured Carboxylicivirga sp.]
MKRSVSFVTIAIVTLTAISTSCSEQEIIDQNIVEMNPEAILLEDTEMGDIEDLISGQIESVTAGDIESLFPTASQLKSSSDEVSYPIKTVEYPNPDSKWPRIITIDYGPENIELDVRRRENVLLRGKVIIKKTKPYRKNGSTRAVSFNKFYFNDLNIVGSKVYTNMGLNDKGNFIFKWVVNLKATDADHFWRKRKVRKEREMVAGGNTKEWKDNKFFITGEVSGSNSKKWNYSRTIIKPLIRLSSYKHPVSGLVKIVNPKKTFWINYGKGKQDNLAIMYYFEGDIKVKKEITLGKKI